MTEPIRVLHVDDDAAFAGTVAAFLEREDDRIDVVTAESGRDGLDLLSARIDCVVSDYRMPGMDGLAFLDAVRAEFPTLPFVLFTGEGSEEIAGDAISAGATDYLRKGPGTDRYALLANRVRNAVSRYRSEQRAAELERVRTLVREVNRALVRADSRGAIERRVCEIVSETRPYRFAWIGGVDPETMEVVPRASAGFPIDVESLRVSADRSEHGQGPIGRAFRTRELQVVQEANDLPLAEWREFADRHEIASLAVVPLVHGGTCYGVLDVYSGRTAAFDEGERELLSELGDDIAHAIHAEAVHERRKEREEKIETLHDTARSFMRAETERGVAEIAVGAMRDILDMRVNSVHLHDEEASTLLPAAWTDAAEDLFGEIPAFPAGESLAWEAFRSGTGRTYEDVSTAEGRLNRDTEMRSEIILPIEDHGVAVIGSTDPGAFEPVDVSLARTVIAHLESALDRIDREAELKRQNERLEEFASVLSHDLRNPLNVAEGRLELARTTGTAEHFDAVEHAHGRIDRLIEDLLSLAQVGETGTNAAAVDLGGVIDRAWSTVATGGATLDVEATSTIRADESQLRRLFENLFRNAVEHGSTSRQAPPDDAVEHGSTSPPASREDAPERGSSHASGEGGAEPGGVTVTVSSLPDGFYVEDDGAGIPEGDREAVFETGYSTAENGTGFGLSIVSEVVEAHGWHVTVTESADGGARFEVTGVDVPPDASS